MAIDHDYVSLTECLHLKPVASSNTVCSRFRCSVWTDWFTCSTLFIHTNSFFVCYLLDVTGFDRFRFCFLILDYWKYVDLFIISLSCLSYTIINIIDVLSILVCCVFCLLVLHCFTLNFFFLYFRLLSFIQFGGQ